MEGVPEEMLLHIFHFVKDEVGVKGILALRLVNHKWLAIAGDTTLEVDELVERAKMAKAISKKKFKLTCLAEGIVHPFGDEQHPLECWCWYGGCLIFIDQQDICVTPLPPPPPSSSSPPSSFVSTEKDAKCGRFPLYHTVDLLHIWEEEKKLVLRTTRKLLFLADLGKLIDPSNWTIENPSHDVIKFESIAKNGNCAGFFGGKGKQKLLLRPTFPPEPPLQIVQPKVLLFLLFSL